MARKTEKDAAQFADLAVLEVNADQLADLFGVRKNTVLHWAREAGMPRISRGRYSLVECVKWHSEKLQNAMTGGGDISEERRGLIAAQRQRHEIETARLRGELIEAEEVAGCLNELAVIFTTQLETLGPKAAPRLIGQTHTGEIARVIHDETKGVRRSTAAAVQAFAGHYSGLEDYRTATDSGRGRVGGREPNTPA